MVILTPLLVVILGDVAVNILVLWMAGQARFERSQRQVT
jgi:hypothetical protein